jgi:alanyl-tRNA synthetase
VFDRKMTDEEKAEVEKIVNEKIKEALVVTRCEMKREEAEALGAEMEFGAKYPEMVSVYMIGSTDASAFSKEFCGGPHVGNTSELGTFKIQKEEAVSQGVRRIKATLS